MINWGILGFGKMGFTFAHAIEETSNSKLIGIASKSGNTFKDFNNNSYQEIINDMKKKRRNDMENFSYKSRDDKCEPMLKQLNEANKNGNWPSSTSIYCWWCCHPFEGPPCSLPYEYLDNKFHVCGIFCSPECAAAYNFDNSSNDEIWERYSLLNFLYRKIYNDKNIKIKLACPRQTLKIFGGNLTIKDFRQLNSNYMKSFKLIIPPMISIIPQQEYNCIDQGFNSHLDKKYVTIKKKDITNNTNELRLKRSKPFISDKNTLEKCMNLKLNK